MLKMPITNAWLQCSKVGLSTLSQIAVLECVQNGMNQSAIAEKTKLTQAGVSQICGVLELSGLITNHRSDKDRRAIVMTITPDGSSLLAALAFSGSHTP